MRELYPEIENVDIHSFDQGDHLIYVEVCGNPEGIPVVFLHGGPGSGCREMHRRFFDPDRYRIILFDQRGCGRSTPVGFLEDNTTQDLIADMETIRKRFSIDRWLLFGGSWGVALALYYAQTFPQNVSGMILRGAFLASKRDMDWFFVEGGASRLFPEQWQKFNQIIPEAEREDLPKAYHCRLFSDDEAIRQQAAKSWSDWATKVVTWTLPEEAQNAEDEDLEILVKQVQLECHYAVNQYFLKSDHLINHLNKLPEVPIKLIHGQRDVTCPLESSWRLHQALSGSELNVLYEAGHLASEASMIDALIKATDDFSNSELI